MKPLKLSAVRGTACGMGERRIPDATFNEIAIALRARRRSPFRASASHSSHFALYEAAGARGTRPAASFSFACAAKGMAATTALAVTPIAKDKVDRSGLSFRL